VKQNVPKIDIYYRARRLANILVWTIDLQVHRLKSEESKDKEFVFRRWADFEFLVIALIRLRKIANLIVKEIKTTKDIIEPAIKEFDKNLPNLKKVRDVTLHIDDYAMDNGRLDDVSRYELEVGEFGDEEWNWLGCKINSSKAYSVSLQLFRAIQNSEKLIKK